MATNYDARDFKPTPTQMRSAIAKGWDIGFYGFRVVTRDGSTGLKIANDDSGRAAVFMADGSTSDVAGWAGAQAAPLADLESLRSLLQRLVDDPAPVFEAIGKA